MLQVNDVCDKDSEIDALTASSRVTVQPNSDPAKHETVVGNSDNNTMRATTTTEDEYAASPQVGSQPKLNTQYINRYT